MIPLQTNKEKLSGIRYIELKEQTLFLFNQIKKGTKRKPYIRSVYFRKQKIFFDYFWMHLFQKNPKERIKRLRYFKAALEVIRKSRNHPISQENPHKRGELLHRFAGLTKEGELFYVQIKEDKRSGKNISCLVSQKNKKIPAKLEFGFWL